MKDNKDRDFDVDLIELLDRVEVANCQDELQILIKHILIIYHKRYYDKNYLNEYETAQYITECLNHELESGNYFKLRLIFTETYHFELICGMILAIIFQEWTNDN